jgi:hypothetical protein
MNYKINALKRSEFGTDLLELLDNSFETKELALEFIKSNLVLDELSYDMDGVVLIIDDKKYHYFEIIYV